MLLSRFPTGPILRIEEDFVMLSFKNIVDRANGLELAAFGVEVVYIFLAAAGLVFATGWVVWTILS